MPEFLTNIDWSYWGAGAIILICTLAGIILTVLTLPGTWLIVVAALGLKLWQPELLSWWIVAAAVLLAIIGEVIEFFASAMGAAKGGASKKGAIASCVGSLAGAILGSPFFFPLGTIVGGVLGAGVGALLAERAWAKKEWTEAAKAGTGAAIGRLAATMAKTALAAVIGLVSSLAVFIP